MFGQTDVQQHSDIVRRHVERIVQVPRPLGSSTQLDKSVVLFMVLGYLLADVGTLDFSKYR
jgi:hypothetical protein